MATKKQKRERGIARREAFEAEQREHGLHFLRLAQQERAEDRKKAEDARKERAKKTSKRLAQQYKREKELEAKGLTVHQPLPAAARKSINKKEH